jgi:hypothetical protein
MKNPWPPPHLDFIPRNCSIWIAFIENTAPGCSDWLTVTLKEGRKLKRLYRSHFYVLKKPYQDSRAFANPKLGYTESW